MIGHILAAIACAGVGTYLVNVGCKKESVSDFLAGVVIFAIGFGILQQLH
jgi:hypothetical protein